MSEAGGTVPKETAQTNSFYIVTDIFMLHLAPIPVLVTETSQDIKSIIR